MSFILSLLNAAFWIGLTVVSCRSAWYPAAYVAGGIAFLSACYSLMVLGKVHNPRDLRRAIRERRTRAAHDLGAVHDRRMMDRRLRPYAAGSTAGHPWDVWVWACVITGLAIGLVVGASLLGGS